MNNVGGKSQTKHGTEKIPTFGQAKNLHLAPPPNAPSPWPTKKKKKEQAINKKMILTKKKQMNNNENPKCLRRVW